MRALEAAALSWLLIAGCDDPIVAGTFFDLYTGHQVFELPLDDSGWGYSTGDNSSPVCTPKNTGSLSLSTLQTDAGRGLEARSTTVGNCGCVDCAALYTQFPFRAPASQPSPFQVAAARLQGYFKTSHGGANQTIPSVHVGVYYRGLITRSATFVALGDEAMSNNCLGLPSDTVPLPNGEKFDVPLLMMPERTGTPAHAEFTAIGIWLQGSACNNNGEHATFSVQLASLWLVVDPTIGTDGGSQ
jgi:hypothetical protein